jgi:hypothetical protein
VYESKLITTTESSKAALQLQAHTGNTLSSIHFTSGSDNITITASGAGTAASPYVIKTELKWVDF